MRRRPPFSSERKCKILDCQVQARQFGERIGLWQSRCEKDHTIGLAKLSLMRSAAAAATGAAVVTSTLTPARQTTCWDCCRWSCVQKLRCETLVQVQCPGGSADMLVLRALVRITMPQRTTAHCVMRPRYTIHDIHVICSLNLTSQHLSECHAGARSGHTGRARRSMPGQLTLLQQTQSALRLPVALAECPALPAWHRGFFKPV